MGNSFPGGLLVPILSFALAVTTSKVLAANKRPPSLINDDHGILSADDLNKADRDFVAPKPFDGKASAYPYWQCFHKRFLSYSCSYQEPLDQQGSSMSLEIKTASARHFYSHSHAISGEVCDDMKERLDRVLREQMYFCIHGTNDGSEESSGKRTFYWSFFRLKTKSGYVHYRLP